jgi:hypothetical protein
LQFHQSSPYELYLQAATQFGIVLESVIELSWLVLAIKKAAG